MLRVFLEDSEPVRYAGRVSVLLSLEYLIELLEFSARRELHVAGSLAHEFIAGSNVSLDDLLEVLKGVLVADPQPRSDSRTWRLVKLEDVDVHEVRGEELPGQSDVVRALGRGTEHKLSIVQVLKELSCFLRVDVLELRVVDSSNVELAKALGSTILVHFEGLVNQVLRLIVETLCNEVGMVLKINTLAGKGDTEQLLIILLDRVDAAGYNIALLDYSLYLTIIEVKLSAVNLSVETVVKFTKDKA